MTARRPALVVLPATLLFAGCLTNTGEGWIVGSLRVESCRDGEALDRPGTFDLGADFFAGDPLFDSDPASGQKRNSLALRIQQTSNRVEEADGLALHFHDLAQVARAFAAEVPLPVSADYACPQGRCVPSQRTIEAQLSLFNTCPGNRHALAGSSRELLADPPPAGAPAAARPATCLRPSGQEIAACPTLSAADQQALRAVCASPFDRQEDRHTIARILGQGDTRSDQRVAAHACVFVCELGQVRVGQSPASLAEFQLEFGEHLAALLSLSLVDSRSLALGLCAQSGGQLQGKFRIKLVRSRAAQAFP
ncbi:MAG: hypothetical protein IT371_17250 [Deltaproteobacteria bacterium]|nr:hypothetical protein [Deltaproteobacteria bacterium]